jgi:hypothetical protein
MGQAWRRRVLGRAKWAVWALLVLLCFLGLTAPYPWGFVVGIATGGLYVGWLTLRDSVPPHIEHWLRGAEGERRTEKALRPLEQAGWVVSHDLKAQFGNVDHLLVGPAGVFLLDSKWWRGTAHVDGDVATVTQVEDPDASWSWPRLPRQLRAASAAQHEAIRKLTGVNAWVSAVAVLWCPFDQGVVTCNRVTYVHGDRLAAWLLEQPRHLSDEQVARIARIIST